MAKFKQVKAPRPAQQQYDEIAGTVEKGMKRVVNLAAKAFRDRVRNWRGRPNFPAFVLKERGSIVGEVQITGSNKAIQKFFWVDEGTRPHTIRPRRAQFLRFRTGYQPKTTPRGGFGGPGRATGRWVTAREVRHPGAAPRKFQERIKREIDPKAAEILRRSVRRGLKKI